MEVMILLICIAGGVVGCWYWHTEPDRVEKLVHSYTKTVLFAISNVKASCDPYDYVHPLAIAFARFLESDTGVATLQPSESAMGYGHLMARMIIDEEVKDALESDRAFDSNKLVIKAVLLRFHAKHPRYGSRHDGLIRRKVASML